MKNKGLLKKWMQLMLMLMMLVLTISGCGSSGEQDDDKEDKVRNEQAKDGEDDEEDREKDKTYDEPEITPEPSPEPTPEATPEPTPEPVKWEEAYEDFFKEYGPLLKENTLIRGEAVLDGIEITMQYAYNKNIKGMVLFVNDKLCEMYSTYDTIYCECEVNDELIKVYAPIEQHNMDVIDNLFWTEIMLKEINNITYDKYLKDVEEDGSIYDVVVGVAKNYENDTTYYLECYINREQQDLSKIIMRFINGDEVCWKISEYDETEINNSVDNVKSMFGENGQEVSISELGNFYADFLDYASYNITIGDNAVKETDWDTYYEGYFDNVITFPDAYTIHYGKEMEGISIGYSVTYVDGETKVQYNIEDNVVDVYYSDEIILVGSPNMNSVDWAYAYLDSREQLKDAMSMIYWEDMGTQTEKATYIEYVGMEQINDSIYDIVEVTFENEQNGQVYINRESQSIYKLCYVTDGGNVEYFFEVNDGIQVPYEATEATEMSLDDIVVYFEEVFEKALETLYVS